jgi:hypothetical protein
MFNRFLSLGPLDRKAIVEGGSATFSDIIERLQWANHAFALQRWAWASRECKLLAQEAAAAGMEGMVRFARYRDAFCLMEETIRHRKAILNEPSRGWAAGWRRVETLCRGAIVANRHANVGTRARFGAFHPVISYNEGCSWSYLGQIVIEASLQIDKHDKLITALAAAADDVEKTKEIWKTELAPHWEAIVKTESRRRLVHNCRTYAMQALRRALPSEGQVTSALFDAKWLGDLAKRDDADLTFLASLPDLDDEWQKLIETDRFLTPGSEDKEVDRLLEDYAHELLHPEMVEFS